MSKHRDDVLKAVVDAWLKEREQSQLQRNQPKAKKNPQLFDNPLITFALVWAITLVVISYVMSSPEALTPSPEAPTQINN